MEFIIDCFYFGVLVLCNILELSFGFSEVPKGEFLNICLIIDQLLLFRNRIKSLGLYI